MRWFALVFAVVLGFVVVVLAARYGYMTSDSEGDGIVAAFIYGSVTLGSLAGHPFAIRLWREKQRTAGFFVGLVAFGALFISMSNSLGAFAGRGNETMAKRMKVAEISRNDKSELASKEKERRGLRFTPTDADAVESAKRRATAATATKEAECKKRGKKCEDREGDERSALDAVEKATAQKSITDRARELDKDIAALKAKIERGAPVLEVNSQGSYFARILNLPDDAASKLTAWQQLSMVIMVDILIVTAFSVFELLGKSSRLEPVREIAPEPEPEEEPQAFEPMPRPKLVASQPEPFGSVPAIMAEILEPGRGRVDFTEAYKSYSAVCEIQGKKPVPPEAFVTELERFCKRVKIGIEGDGKGKVWIKKARLKNYEKKSSDAH